MINHSYFSKSLRLSLLVSLVSVMAAFNVYAMNEEDPFQNHHQQTHNHSEFYRLPAPGAPDNQGTQHTGRSVPMIAAMMLIHRREFPNLTPEDFRASFQQHLGNLGHYKEY